MKRFSIMGGAATTKLFKDLNSKSFDGSAEKSYYNYENNHFIDYTGYPKFPVIGVADARVILAEALRKAKGENTTSVPGYVAPKDLFAGHIAKGTVYVKAPNGSYKPTTSNLLKYRLPVEIVESWDKSSTLKKGDYVTITGNRYSGSIPIGTTARIAELGRENSRLEHPGYPTGTMYSNSDFRVATAVEIAEASRFRIGGYDVTYGSNSVSIGCRKFSMDTVRDLITNGVASLTISGVTVSSAEFIRVLKDYKK